MPLPPSTSPTRSSPGFAATPDTSENPWATRAATPVLVRADSSTVRKYIRRVATNSVPLAIVVLLLIPWALLMPAEVMSRVFISKVVVGIGGPCYALWMLFRNIRYLADVHTHPALDWAELGHPRQVAENLDRELASIAQHQLVDKVIFTSKWMIRYCPMLLEVVPLSAIAWAYKKEVTRKMYGIVTTGRSYSLVVDTCSSRSFTVAGKKEKVVDALLHEIADRAPWSFVGYTGTGPLRRLPRHRTHTRQPPLDLATHAALPVFRLRCRRRTQPPPSLDPPCADTPRSHDRHRDDPLRNPDPRAFAYRYTDRIGDAGILAARTGTSIEFTNEAVWLNVR